MGVLSGGVLEDEREREVSRREALKQVGSLAPTEALTRSG